MDALFEDQFVIKNIEDDKKKFELVARVKMSSENYEMELTVDINTQIYPVNLGEEFTIVLAATLNLDGTPDVDEYLHSDKPSLADNFDYVMGGKVFRSDAEEAEKLSVYVSFGGLLMRIHGDARHLSNIALDSRVYLLMRRV